MNSRTTLLIGAFIVAAASAACGRANDEAPFAELNRDEGEDEHGDEDGEVAYKPELGLVLKPEVRDALGLKTTTARERLLADNLHLLAQVFAVKPTVLASATVPADHQEHFTKHSFKNAKLVRLDRSATGSTQLVDLTVELYRRPSPAVGDFVELDFGAEPSSVLAVPLSALLDAAAGTFVYVVNGEHYRRTPVKVGARTEDFVEIVEGLTPGDEIVAAPVEQLWLAELRLTKGGGHSH